MSIGNEPVILTHSGKYVNFVVTDPDTICIEDIAYALSNICRYTGHCDRFYSVAEHSIRCMQMLRRCGFTPRAQMAALMHDATEAYLGDISSPLKRILPDYQNLEQNMERVIERKFGINFSHPMVKVADLQLLATERKYLLTADQTVWDCISTLDPDAEKFGTPADAYRAKMAVIFLDWFHQLERDIAEYYPDGHNDL